jgi:hypothetical protein
VKRLQRDSDETVRAVARHTEEDAMVIHAIADLLAGAETGSPRFGDRDFARRTRRQYSA